MKLMTAGFFLALMTCSVAISSADTPRPNIILMMCDDLGWGDTGFNGHPIIQTPNLDQMATEGAVCNHFYSIGPVCSPTRGSYLTGRHYYRFGIWTANVGHLPKEEMTIARMLKDSGYVTGHFGKWHLGTLSRTVSAKGKKRRPEVNYAPPWERDYDRSFVTESAVQTWNPAQGRRSTNNPYYDDGQVASENLEGCDSRVMMDRIVPFIRNAASNDTPFLAVVWFHAPHADIEAGPDYLAKYEGHGEAAHYYGCITAMDEQVGRLRAEVRNLGLEDNTAMFFCSDNGPEGKTPKNLAKTRRAGSAGPFSGRKRSVLDGGVRVPALAVWPGEIKPGTKIDVPMSVLDYLPTVSTITGVKIADDQVIDGEDVLPILKGANKSRQRSIPFRFNEYACLVKGKFKLIIEASADTTKDRLFDLSRDTQERDNVVERYPEMRESMRGEILDFLKSAQSSHRGGDYPAGDYKPTDDWRGLDDDQ